MITRFDHAVIGVRDVKEAIRAFAELGFEVFEGGRHPSLGTRNAIIRFGIDYLELLAVENEKKARASGPFGSELANFSTKGSGLVGFVLASSNLEDEAKSFLEKNIEYNGPFEMDRKRPDGITVAWKLVVPGSSPWRKPWPFLIEWETTDKERLQLDPIGTHSNESAKVLGIDLVVGDLFEARTFYEEGLGLVASKFNATNLIGKDSVTYNIDGFSLNVKLPSTEEEEFDLEKLGPGPYRLILGSRSLPDTYIYRETAENLRLFEFDRIAALGARIALVVE